ncbi:MAG: sarcosine oxidase subunit delta [Paracoccaceae bacterium]
MRITCPHCGERDLREFTCRGSAVALHRPAPDADVAAWDDYVFVRDNVAGEVRDLWHHSGGCAAWIVVTRNTVSHAVLRTELASSVRRASR